MKKMISLLLALMLCLCACSGNAEATEAPAEATPAPTEATAAPTEAPTAPPVTAAPTEETAPPTEATEAVAVLHTPFIGKWVCSDGYYVTVNEDGSLIYNDEEYTPAYFEMGGGVAVYLEEAEYTYYAGMDKNGEVYITTKGCVFVWGLTERFGEGVMVGDHDGRHFLLQTE